MENKLDQGQKKSIPHRFLRTVLIIGGIFILICGLLALVIAYKYAGPLFSPLPQVILEPDYALVSSIDAVDLETDAEILTARASDLGIQIRFVVRKNNQIVAQAPIFGSSENLTAEMISIGLLELVDFGETPIEAGTIIATDFGYPYFPQVAGTKWHTVLTNAEFESAEAEQDAFGGYQIAFTLTADGKKILSDYSTENVGRYLGIVMDKVVISAPIVNAPITEGQGVIAGNFTQEEAESMAASLNVRGPLPIPLKFIEVSDESK